MADARLGLGLLVGEISFSASDVTLVVVRITSPAVFSSFEPKTLSDVIKWGATVTSRQPLRGRYGGDLERSTVDL